MGDLRFYTFSSICLKEFPILKGSHGDSKRGYTEMDAKREAASLVEAPAARLLF